MRISEGHKSAQLLTRIQSNLAAKQKAMAEVATGSRVHKASDDPEAFAIAAKFRAQEVRFERMGQTNDQLSSVLEHSDRMLGNATSVLDEALSVSLQFASDGYSATQMNAAAQAVAGLKESLLEVANTRFQGAYVFGGISDQQPPFTSAGDYQGSDLGKVVEIAPQEFVQTSTGSEIFGGQSNVFQLLDSLENALLSGDTNSVRASVDQLRSHRTNVVDARQEIGHQLETIEHARSFLEVVQAQAKIGAGNATDADPAAAISNLLSTTNTLEALTRSENRMQGLLDQLLKL